MNKTELRKIAKSIINERFEMFSNIKIVEINCERSTIDKMLYINYVVIVNDYALYRVHISEDDYCGTTDIFVKETFMKEGQAYTGLYNSTTCEQIF